MKTLLWKRLASAKPYDFKDDTELGRIFGYDFGTYDGNEADLRVGDGYNAYQLVSVDGLYQFFDTYAAQDRGITNGTSATSFSPNDTCTKAQIVTFLYRALK